MTTAADYAEALFIAWVLADELASHPTPKTPELLAQARKRLGWMTLDERAALNRAESDEEIRKVWP